MGYDIIVSPDETFWVTVHIPVKSPKRARGITFKRIKYAIKVGERGALDIKRVK